MSRRYWKRVSLTMCSLTISESLTWMVFSVEVDVLDCVGKEVEPIWPLWLLR